MALASVPGVGPGAYARLLRLFGGAGAALEAGVFSWSGLAAEESAGLARVGLERATRAAKRALKHGEELLRAGEELGCTVLTWGERGYPVLLGLSPSPPLVLYVRGALREEDWRAIAVVGTRRASAYGRWQAAKLAGELVADRFMVASGLARGVDEAAHRGALEAGGRTVAVLGCGPDRVYPRENAALAAEIASHGAVVTEFPPGTIPKPENFPRRNRIIAGLTLGTVVVEAGERSGALNTAFQASDAGREVFSVPGEVGRPGSAGTHALLRMGATLLDCGSQVKEELPYLEWPGFRFGPGWRRGPLQGNDWWGRAGGSEQADGPRNRLWLALREGPGRAEELSARTGLPVSLVAAQLVAWELEGKVRGYQDGRVAPARR